MTRASPYPESFPDATEEAFLRLVLAPDAEFRPRWDAWRRVTVFDEIPFAVLRALPMLHLRLAALSIEDGEITGRIRGVYRQAWFRNQLLLDRTATIVADFAKAGIPVMLLKGVAMMTDVFPSAGARMTNDADLLVREQDVEAAVAGLRKAGWHQVGLALSDAVEFAGAHTALSHAATFEMPDRAKLDLHWQAFHNAAELHPLRLLLLRKPPAQTALTEAQWSRARPGHIKGVPVLLQSLEDMLLHTMVHGARGNAHRPFRWVLDAAAIIATGQADFGRFAAIAAATPYAIHARIACRYLADRMAVPVPADAIAALDAVAVSDKAVRGYYAAARLRPPALLGSVPSIWYVYWKAQARGGLAGRLLRFPDYLRRQWALPPEIGLARFAIARYRARLPARLRRAVGR
jgi:hypothetical protein